MKSKSSGSIASFRASIRTAARSARRKAFRKGLPVAISKNGKVIFVYRNNKESVVKPSFVGKPK